MLQPHAAVPLPPLAPEVRQVRRAPLRRTDFERFGHTDNCPGCANARAGRKQAVGHSEHCRSRMEAILVMTTTNGHERLERTRDRFAQAAKEPEDEAPQRKRHRPEGEGGQPLAPPGEGGSSSSCSGSALPPPPAPPPLEPPPLAERSLEQETEMTDATVEQQGESTRRREHPEAPQAAESSSSSSSESSTDTEMSLVDMCTILRVRSEAESRYEGGPITLDLTKWDFNKIDCRNNCTKLLDNLKPLLLMGSPIDSGRENKERARGVLHLAFICELYETQPHGGRYFLQAHSPSADSWEQSAVLDFMNRFPDTFQTLTHRSLFGPPVFPRYEHVDEMVDKFRMGRTGISSLTHSSTASNDHECNVSAIATRPGCRWNFGSIAASSANVKSKLPVKRKYSTCGTWRCTSTPLKRKHGHEQDATQLASSGSTPIKEVPKAHVTARVWCVRKCVMKGSNRSSRQHLHWKLCESCSVLRARKTFRVEDPFLISIADVSRAHVYAGAVRDVYVRLPDEDPKAKQPGVYGKLRKTMYGSLDAAQRWGERYAQVLEAGGFSRGVTSPCHFFHKGMQNIQSGAW